MTVQKDITKNIYVGNGSTTVFPFTFECPAEHQEYIKVYFVAENGMLNRVTDYTLNMDSKQITYPNSGEPLKNGTKIVIMRELPLQQLMNLVNNGPFFAEDIETAFDECVMIMQQISEKLKRTITMSTEIDGDAFVNEVPFEPGKSFRISDDGKSVVLTEDPARVLPLAESALQQAQAQAQAAAESAANAASNTQLAGQYADDAQSAMNTATKKAEQAADSATSAGVSANHAQGSMQNAQTYMQAAQKAMQQAGEFLEQAGSAAGSAQASAKEAKETAATIRSIAEEVAAVQKYLDAAQAAANEAATSESNAKGYANTATLAAQGANESLQQAQQQAEEAQGFAAIATTQAQEANKDAVSAAGSAMQAQAALDTLLANDDLISPDFATLNTAKCGDVVPPLYAVWDVAEIVVAARFGEMQAA